jgi:SAM-dependent methyltransferase
VFPGTFDRIPLEDDSIDALVALDVLEHCEDDAASIAEAARVVRPGGCLVMTVPALHSLWSPHDDANRHFRRYQRAELVRVVAGGGFEVERATYFNSLLLPLVYAARLGAKAAHRQGLVGTRPPWGPVNAALRTVFSAEEPWLRRRRLPIGASLMVSARRSSRDGRGPVRARDA